MSGFKSWWVALGFVVTIALTAGLTVLVTRPKAEVPVEVVAPREHQPPPPDPDTRKAAPEVAPRADLFPYRRVVALVVGIDRYPTLLSAGDLTCAVRDAEAVGEVLSKGYGFEVVKLLNGLATKSAIEATIQKYCSELGDREALVVFFAGHGQSVELPGSGETSYLVPADAALDFRDKTDVARWAAQGLDMRKLADTMEKASAQHVLLIADACCSGSVRHRGALARWELKTLFGDRSRAVLTSTNRRQQASENPTTNHGDFTTALLAELKKEEPASVLDLYYPLSRTVPNATSGRMTPQLAQFGDGDGMFVFVPVSVPKDERVSALDGVALSPERPNRLADVAKRVGAFSQQWTTPAELYALIDGTWGWMARFDEDRRRDQTARFERFLRNARAGDATAKVAVSYCYQNGLGVEKDAKEALYWARRVDEENTPPGAGRYLLGLCYELGIGIQLPADRANAEADRLFAESAKAGFPPGQLALAEKTVKKTINAATIKTARELSEKAAAAGLLSGKVVLAQLMGPDENAKARALLADAAGKNSPIAHLYLSRAHVLGSIGYPHDVPKAQHHLRQAADMGMPIALVALGTQYASGKDGLYGLPLDEREALRLYEMAAELGETTPQPRARASESRSRRAPSVGFGRGARAS